MRRFNRYFFLGISLAIVGCASHHRYGTAEFRERGVDITKLALDEDGLTEKQIEVISSTKPPVEYPIDIAVIFLKNGYIGSKSEDIFAYEFTQRLKSSPKVDRITLIPDFLVPQRLSFNSMQELGIRSLSEYVVVFNLDSDELFKWTKIVESKFEINSSISYIIVDSYTSAMVTSDRLFSKQEYIGQLFKLEEREQAQKQLFQEQARILSENLDALFSDSSENTVR